MRLASTLLLFISAPAFAQVLDMGPAVRFEEPRDDEDALDQSLDTTPPARSPASDIQLN